MQASKLEVELAEQQQQLEEAACCLQRTQLQHQAQLADLQLEHEQRYMAMLRQQQVPPVEQQSSAAALQQALQQGSVAAAAAALLGRQLGGDCSSSSSSSKQVAQQRPSYAGIAATVAAVFGGPAASPVADATAANLSANCSSSKCSSAAPVQVAQAAAAAAAAVAAVGVGASPKTRPSGPQLAELMACLAERSSSNPQLSQHPHPYDSVQQQQPGKQQQAGTQQRDLSQPAAVIEQNLASPQPDLPVQSKHRTIQKVQKARQSNQGYATDVTLNSSSSDVNSQCQPHGNIVAEDSEVSPSKLQAKLATYRNYLKHASPTKNSAAAAAVAPSSSSDGGCGTQVKTPTQHPGSFHSQSDGGVQMQRSSEEQQQHWPAVTSMSDGGVVLQSPAGPAVAEASFTTLPAVVTVAALQAEDPHAAAEEVVESHPDEASCHSSTRTSDDSWGTASNACSRAGSLQVRQLSSSMSVTSSLINVKRQSQSLQDSGQLTGLASYARFAAASGQTQELQGQQPPQIAASACSAAHFVDLGVPRQPALTGRVSSSDSTASRRGSQLSSSCSAIAGLDKRQVRAEIAAAGGMAAIVEQFSSSLFEAAGGGSAPGCAAAAAVAVQSWARQPAASVIDTAASSSVDVVPLESGAFRATRTKKQTAGHSPSVSSGSVLGGDNRPQVYDQVALVQQQQQQQQQVQKMLRRSQAAASNSNRMGW
jgi:hypothetical protein